jgi:molecular chaperone DnaK
MSKIIGIDLGTTNSCVAVMEGKSAKVLANQEGDRTTPSIVAFDDKEQVLVGNLAKRQAVMNPENTVFSAKRLIGRRHDELSNVTENLPYEVVAGEDASVNINIRGKNYSPPEISAHVLRKLKQAAEDYLGSTVTEAVITVPAYFNDSQRQATKDAGKIAGLEVRRIINEPTAAALAYGLDKSDDQVIAVYDLGGGTFDVSVLEIGDGIVEVLATNGDTQLGGDNVDEALIDYLAKEFKKTTGVDIKKDNMALQRLKEGAERAKIELSNKMETEVNIPFITADATGPKHMQQTISRAKFESLISKLVAKTFKSCSQALKDCGKANSDIDEVILVGGSTRIPLVQQKVQEFFDCEPHKGVNPDEVVANGAAIQGGVLSGDVTDVLLLDVTPLSLGIETLGGVMTTLVPRNTTVPVSKKEIFSTAENNQSAVTVHVLQGERSVASGNRSLATFNLEGVPPAPRGVPQIEVVFDIDADGILNVSAIDKATNKQQTVKVEASGALSDSDVEKAVQEAEEYADKDKEYQEKVQTKNNLDQLVYQTEKLFDEHGSKLSDEDKQDIDNALKDAKAALESDDVAQMDSAQEALQSVAHKISEAMYAEQQAAQEQQPPQDDHDDGEIIDAEAV